MLHLQRNAFAKVLQPHRPIHHINACFAEKNISYLLLTLLAISWPGFNARAGVGFDRQRAETEQLRLLSQAASRADSLTVTWNLFDIALGTARRKYIDSVWKLARETNDTTSILEAARQRANQYMTNDSVLDGIRHEIEQYPESNDRNETLLSSTCCAYAAT